MNIIIRAFCTFQQYILIISTLPPHDSTSSFFFLQLHIFCFWITDEVQFGLAMCSRVWGIQRNMIGLPGSWFSFPRSSQLPTAAKAGAEAACPSGIAERLALVHECGGPALVEFLGDGQSLFLSLKGIQLEVKPSLSLSCVLQPLFLLSRCELEDNILQINLDEPNIVNCMKLQSPCPASLFS